MLLALVAHAALGAPAGPSRDGAGGPGALPEALLEGLARAQVATANTSFLVLPLDGGALRLRARADTPMNPASTMKLLTTFAALATLGPDYRWHTRVYATRPLQEGRLQGDLVVRGEGDPSLVIERWWLLIERLRALGLREIDGDLVLDRTRYGGATESGPAFDSNDLRPYNVPPDALLINFRAQSFEFLPDPAAGVAHVVATPRLDGVKVPTQVALRKGPCGDWKSQLRADFSAAAAPRFHGGYAASCGPRTWYVSRLGADDYALASFRALWRASGGSFRGKVRAGRVGAQDILLAEQESRPLAEVIRDINKNSNNVMARQLFLTLGQAGAASGAAAPSEDSAATTLAAPGGPTGTDTAGAEAEPAAQRESAQATGATPVGMAEGAAAHDGVAPPDPSRALPPTAAPAPAPDEADANSMPPGAAEAELEPATAQRSGAFLRDWLARQGLAMPELVLQNGSGLSRQERISAASLGQLLTLAWNSTDMPTFLASLPLAGVDGTMQHRRGATHAAYVKTGTLAAVRALAGYVFAASGRRYAIVAFVNDAHAAAAQDVLDDFLQWVWEKG